MALKFGDQVVLVQKSLDNDKKEVIRRVKATVLDSVTQPPNVNPREALRDHRGIIPEGEHLELIFPRTFLNGQPPKARDLDLLFQRAVSVPQWKEGLWIGWELPAPPPVLPSAADLDATEEEKKAAEATSGKVRQIKGK
jgi:hypothetical protein